jgi:multicomponent Na+:H+ antiporter subunit E
LVFSCPACGLDSSFSAVSASPGKLKALQGSAWNNELRQYLWAARPEAMPHERAATPRHFLAVMIISFLTWIVLTGSFNPVELLWGFVVSAAVARFSYRFVAFDLPRWVVHPRRWLYFLDLLFDFARQLIVQNITLSLRVFNPRLPIRPGIVAVPTKLHGDVNLTILGSLMTLTPDTVAIDIDQQKGLIYVHWIDVQTTEPEQARQMISADLEERIIRWLL